MLAGALTHIHGVSVYMGPIWLLITVLIIMFCSFCLRFEKSILEQLLIFDHNSLVKRGKIVCVTLYKLQAKFCRNFNFNNYPQKSLGTQISNHKASKQPQQEGRKSPRWQENDCKISWQSGCSERFCRKESEKVPPRTFPRSWSFTYTFG